MRKIALLVREVKKKLMVYKAMSLKTRYDLQTKNRKTKNELGNV